MDGKIKSPANELSKLLRAHDMALTFNKLGYDSGSMFFPAAIRIFARSHSVLSKAESIWRQYQ
jgi:hypothetical protein